MDLHSPVCAWYTWFGSVPSSPVGESDSAVAAEMMAVMANVDTAAAISMHATPQRDVMMRFAQALSDVGETTAKRNHKPNRKVSVPVPSLNLVHTVTVKNIADSPPLF